MKIIVTIHIESDLDKVWEYWTSPVHIVHWNFASDDWDCPKAENDLQPNGKFLWRMEAKDGSMGFDFEGTYTEVLEKERISYQLTDGRNVEIEFTVQPDGVTVKESFEPEEMNAYGLQRAGWQAILDNFKKYVES